MELLKEFEAEAKAYGEGGGFAVPARGRSTMLSQVHCAYNQTRECFLGLEVMAADLTPVQVSGWIAARPLRSGEGLWLMPFRGVPAGAVLTPLDLICLDEDCRVIETVESFPTLQPRATLPQPWSVLALPAHSIYSSQTQAGDQLVLCVAEEMGSRLARLSDSGAVAAAPATQLAGAALVRETPIWSGGPGVLELSSHAGRGSPPAEPAYEMELARPGAAADQPPRAWLDRWWSPDPRKAPRKAAAGLAAYYWNGSNAHARAIRDISATGLYVVTEERWYPGTLVLMTLERSDRGEQVAEQSIAVESRAVRWGPDGVGLQFILPGEQDRPRGQTPLMDAAGRIELERFLEQLKIDPPASAE